MYWEDGSLPRDSLTRAASRLKEKGSLYLGGGVGVEVKKDGQYNVIGGGTHDGPLSAVTQALSLAGAKTSDGTPGGSVSIKDPAVAARIFELDSERAEQEARIARYQRMIARAAKDPLPYSISSPSSTSEDSWQIRSMREAQERIKQIEAERRKLLAAKTEEAVREALAEDPWGGKPGPNAAQVTPDAKKKLSGLMRYYAKKPHPFTACVRDNTKRFGPERAKRVCAVLKDLIRGTTHWRNKEEEDAMLESLLEAAGGDAEGLEAYLLASIQLKESA